MYCLSQRWYVCLLEMFLLCCSDSSVDQCRHVLMCLGSWFAVDLSGLWKCILYKYFLQLLRHPGSMCICIFVCFDATHFHRPWTILAVLRVYRILFAPLALLRSLGCVTMNRPRSDVRYLDALQSWKRRVRGVRNIYLPGRKPGQVEALP